MKSFLLPIIERGGRLVIISNVYLYLMEISRRHPLGAFNAN